MGKTYTNVLSQDEISLGITRLLAAPQDTSWTPARVDISSPPASFVDLGAVVDDTPKLTVDRDKFEIRTGIPRVLQYQQIVALDGKMEAQLESKDYSKVDYSLGNTDPDTSSWATTPASDDYVIQYLGTRQLKEFVLLGVTDFIDGTQVVHHLQRAKPGGTFEEMYRPDQEGRVNLNFDLLATETYISSVAELIIGTRYQFGPDGSGV